MYTNINIDKIPEIDNKLLVDCLDLGIVCANTEDIVNHILDYSFNYIISMAELYYELGCYTMCTKIVKLLQKNNIDIKNKNKNLLLFIICFTYHDNI